jgi:hypothetical protein
MSNRRFVAQLTSGFSRGAAYANSLGWSEAKPQVPLGMSNRRFAAQLTSGFSRGAAYANSLGWSEAKPQVLFPHLYLNLFEMNLSPF